MEFNFEIFKDLLNLCRLSQKELNVINRIFKNRPLNYIDNVLYDCPKKLIYYSSELEPNYHVYVTEYLNSLVVIFKGNTFLENEIKLISSKRKKRIRIQNLNKKIQINKRCDELLESVKKKINLKIKDYLKLKINNHEILGDDEHILNRKSIIFTGHGFGGTISILGCVKFANQYKFKQVDFYSVTFGSPNVGGLSFSNLFNKSVKNSYRFLSDADENILGKHFKNLNKLKGNIWLYQDQINNRLKILRYLRKYKNYFKRKISICNYKKKGYTCKDYLEEIDIIENLNKNINK